jgi:hypothetical protein
MGTTFRSTSQGGCPGVGDAFRPFGARHRWIGVVLRAPRSCSYFTEQSGLCYTTAAPFHIVAASSRLAPGGFLLAVKRTAPVAYVDIPLQGIGNERGKIRSVGARLSMVESDPQVADEGRAVQCSAFTPLRGPYTSGEVLSHLTA